MAHLTICGKCGHLIGLLVSFLRNKRQKSRRKNVTEIYYLSQIERLKRRFGERHFDPEFIKLVALEAHQMSDLGFQRTVDVMIGSRTANKPPLLSDFREARRNEEKHQFDNMTRAAAQVLSLPAKTDGLKKILKEQYGNAESVNDAIDLVKFRKRMEESK